MRRSAIGRTAPIKRKAPKKRTGHDKKALAACRGQNCWLVMTGSNADCDSSNTVVPCHRNEGKGMGLKVPDIFTVPGCAKCHAIYDQSGMAREVKREMFNAAYARWAPYREQNYDILEVPLP